MISFTPLDLDVGRRQFRLEADPEMLAVTYDDELSGVERLQAEFGAFGAAVSTRYEVPAHRVTIIAQSQPDPGPERLAGMREVENAFPVFRMNDKRVVMTAQISVGFDSSQTSAADISNRTGFPVSSEGPDYVVLDVPPDVSPLVAVQEITPIAGVSFVEPDLVTIGRPVRPATFDIRPFDASAPVLQKAFRNVDLQMAWDIVGTPRGVTIAVLDDGVDSIHPALAAATQDGYDAIQDQPGAQPNPWDYHGTSCAGLLVGEHDGYRGVAAGLNLLAVKIAESPAPDQPWATSNSILRRGIDWAIARGADVLSNSWGGPPSTLITHTVIKAQSEARKGKGAIFVFAAGNSGGPVEFPATLKGTLAVGAVNLADEHKTRFSSDGESWWASNTGPEIDITAPAIGIKTSDISGGAGRTPTDWRDDFNGTSAACPIVAGAAGLLLAQASDLSRTDLLDMLTSAAEKIGPIQYDATGRNDVFGHGRLNIAAALQAVIRGQSVSGIPDLIPLSSSVEVFVIYNDPGHVFLFAADPQDRTALIAAVETGTSVEVKGHGIAESALGLVLLGARLTKATPVPISDPQSADPAPDEVLLPRPEDDVFAGLGANATSETGYANDLSDVKGIGPSRQKQFQSLGVQSLHELAELSEINESSLADQFGSLANMILRDGWIRQARDLLGDTTTDANNRCRDPEEVEIAKGAVPKS
jgi:thermitase